MFSVNGQLLQGYGIMRQVKKEGITLEDLMAQLEADFPMEDAQEQDGIDRSEAASQEQEAPLPQKPPRRRLPLPPPRHRRPR